MSNIIEEEFSEIEKNRAWPRFLQVKHKTFCYLDGCVVCIPLKKKSFKRN